MDRIKKLYNKLDKIEYGFYDKKNNLHKKIDSRFFLENYRMQDINKIIDNKYAIFWELCEYERMNFKKFGYPFIVIFAILKNLKHKPCHTFLIFKYEENYYWFESSWKKMKGIKKYDSLKSILDDVKDNFYEFTYTKEYNKDDISFYIYKKPHKHIGCKGFYYNALLFGKKIKNEYVDKF